jgi:DNA-binding MarR family transcriptional regulator
MREVPVQAIDPKLLLWLLHHPFQRVSDLALPLGVHLTTVYRHLMRLNQAGLVHHLALAGKTSGQHLYYLTHEGLLTVATERGTDLARLARYWNADEAGLLRLLPRLRTLLLIQEVINSLVEQAPTIFAEQGRRVQLTWHWQRDWRQQFFSRGHAMTCRAEAVLVLRHPSSTTASVSGSYYTLLFLADGGLYGWNDHALMERRLEQLLCYRESAERTAHYHHFPLVVILVQHPHQQNHWQRAARDVAAKWRLDPLQGVVACIPPGRSYTSAWSLPWHQLTTDAPCRLQDVLLPMPLESLPLEEFPHTTARDIRHVGSLRKHRLVPEDFTPRVSQRPVRGARGERLTSAWLGKSLSPHQQHLLEQVYRSPLITTEEVAAFCGLTVATTTRALFALQQVGCLSRRHTACGRRWHLSSDGLRFIAASLGVPIQHLAEGAAENDTRLQRGVPVLLRTMRHTAGIYRFLALLHQAAHEQGHQVAWHDTGPRCEQTYHHRGAWHTLRPDAALGYVAGAQHITAWLEWDEGTMTSGGLAAKMWAYLTYLHTREWAKEPHPLPLLLIVTPEPGQERRMRQRGVELAEAGMRVYTTTGTRLRDQGPLGAIWVQITRKQTPSEAERRSWLDLTSL